MRRIMLATDFSERSDRALRRAAMVARAGGAVLDLVHVVDDDRPTRIVEQEAAEARTMLRALAGTLATGDGLHCETAVVLADPFDGIVQAAAERRPDLLVLGPHRRHILKDAFVGTTAERTIRSVGCPVVMANGPPVAPWRHVLLTTDLSQQSAAALRRFAALGLAPDARRTLLHVFGSPALRLSISESLPDDRRKALLADEAGAARGALAQFLAGVEGLEAEPVVRYDATTFAHEIARAAAAMAADLVVVSTRGRGGLARLFLGSVAAQVLAGATVDVLALPPGEAATG
jgi:nucleotide-binding universal stress UspA family protein